MAKYLDNIYLYNYNELMGWCHYMEEKTNSIDSVQLSNEEVVTDFSKNIELLCTVDELISKIDNLLQKEVEVQQ